MKNTELGQPVDIPGAEVWEVAELRGEHPLRPVAVRQLDRFLNLFCNSWYHK